MIMATLEELRNSLPDFARDIKLNLQTVPSSTSLSPAQRWGVAVASAAASRNPELLSAVLSEARREAGEAIVDDALAAASLMGMNNIYYRFRHMIGKPSYSEKPARLRMQRLAKPATNKTDFELFSLAASAITGCEACVKAHEEVVLAGGLTEDQIHDAIRVSATVHAAAVSLELHAAVSPAGVAS